MLRSRRFVSSRSCRFYRRQFKSRCDMREKVLPEGSSPQPGKEIGLGKLPLTQTTDKTVPSGLHTPPENQKSSMCRCAAGDDKTSAEAGSAPELGRLSKAAIALPLLLIRVYQLTLSPFIGQCCRFTPSCSRYAAEALKVHGFWYGSFLTIYRLLRCQPWCKGGYDPVPLPKKKKNSPRD